MSKRVTVFMGHYGSGKTFLSVNYAIALKKSGKKTTVFDLDIVNPYFRTVDAKNLLDENGVDLVVSKYAETNIDIPAMDAKSYKIVDDLNSFAVVDVGGDDRGALALGRFRNKIILENNYDAFFVVNKFRPETTNINDVLIIKQEIERAGGLKFTGIINNSNLGDETTDKEIIEGYEFCLELSNITGIPLVFTSVREDLVEKVSKKIDKIFTVKPIKYGKGYNF